MDLSIAIYIRNGVDRLEPMLAALAELRGDRRCEVLLVDNASTDETLAVLHDAKGLDSFKRVLTAKYNAPGATHDLAWRNTKGDLVTFTDDDCYLQPDFVDAIVAVFAESPDLARLGGRFLLHDVADVRIMIDERELADSLPSRSFVKAGWLQGANLSFQRSALEAIAGIDPELGAEPPFPCEDIDAVAATVWAGLPTGFDPRPVAWHHHGRKAHDLPNAKVGYDMGRGAFYAKSVLHREGRSTYLKGWLREVRKRRSCRDLAGLHSEFSGARQYLLHRRKTLTLAAVTPLALALYAWFLVQAGTLGMSWRFRNAAQ